MLRYLTTFISTFAVAATVVAALVLVFGYYDETALYVGTAHGPALVGTAFVAIVLAWVAKNLTGLRLLDSKKYQDVVAYCTPRCRVTLAVGRAEAARNRYCAAWALCELEQPSRALAVLDEEHRMPQAGSLPELLDLARARALLDLGRRDEAEALYTKIETAERPLERRAKEALSHLAKLLEQEDG